MCLEMNLPPQQLASTTSLIPFRPPMMSAPRKTVLPNMPPNHLLSISDEISRFNFVQCPRCEKMKSGKSVEQCENKVKCLRLSGGGLHASHWPWFKKIEQIVGSLSSSTKVILDEVKPPTLGGPAATMR